MNNDKLISIVIPAYNSEKTLFDLTQEIVKEFNNYKIEILLVNDDSKDQTPKICEKILENLSSDITYIKLRKNFGEHNAVMAGLNYAKGDWVLIMDDDFQNPPSEARKLTDFALNNNYDVVFSKYKTKKHNFFRNLGSSLTNFTSSIILNKPKNLYLSSFKIIRGDLIKKICEYKGPFPYLDGLILNLTSNISSIITEHSARNLGKSNYTLSKLVSLYFNMFTNFSTKPIRIFSIFGLIISLVAACLIIYEIYYKLTNPEAVIGLSSIFVIILFFSGIQIIFLGLLGEYIGRILLNVNNSSQYEIEQIKKNF